MIKIKIKNKIIIKIKPIIAKTTATRRTIETMKTQKSCPKIITQIQSVHKYNQYRKIQ